MNLVNELRAKSINIENTKAEVIAEIKASFDKFLDSEKFEKHLEKYIDTSDIKQRKTSMKVEFWEYHDACSTTHFNCGGVNWYNTENRDGYKSHTYKGVELASINKEVCEYLSTKLEDRMRELGFTLLSREKQKSRFDDYETCCYFGW